MSLFHLLSHLAEAALFGTIQGLAEFLPISSSGHLLLLHNIINLNAVNEQTFDVALHIGTLVALVIYFWSELGRLIMAAWKWLTARPTAASSDQRLVLFLIIASIPGAILGALFESFFENAVRTTLLVAIMLMAAGVWLWAADRWNKSARPIEAMSAWRALIIGCGQALALIPGVSRSGASIAMARWLGLSREAAARFSFLMAIPIVAGAGAKKALELNSMSLTGQDWLDLTVGFLFAAVTGYLAIKVLLRFVSNHSYAVFAVYRFVLGVVVLTIVLVK